MSAESTAKVIFGNNYIFELDAKPGVLFWSCKLHVDADGHPQAYHPDGSPPGLDYLGNAGKPGNWWGISCDSAGNPYCQGPDHEASGYYVSTTALEDHTIQSSNPARYVHSGKVPFFGKRLSNPRQVTPPDFVQISTVNFLQAKRRA